MKYPNMDWGKMEAVVNKLYGMEGVKRFLRGELVVCESVRLWSEKNNVITFSVTSDGTTGEDWIKRLEGNGHIGDYVKQILSSPDFKPTDGVTTKVAVLKGTLFGDAHDQITTKEIRTEANGRNLVRPNAEVACLIREKFSNMEIGAMGLRWIATMHKPIKFSDNGSMFLHQVLGGGCSTSRLQTFAAGPDIVWWHCGCVGFAFAVPQASSQH